MDILDELFNCSKTASNEKRLYIDKVLENTSGYVKIGDNVQSHAFIDEGTYTIFGGNSAHRELLLTFLDEHSGWKNLGMDLTAFFKCEKAVLFNTTNMCYSVWVPV